MALRITATCCWLLMLLSPAKAQDCSFHLEQEHDSLFFLVLDGEQYTDRWRLPYPVYATDCGDVDGNGTTDILVGVEKRTRFDPDMKRRLWLFKVVNGRIRPLWLGSQLGGLLMDFKFIDGQVRTLQASANGYYVVMTHKWRTFGLGADSILLTTTDLDAAKALLSTHLETSTH